MKKIVHGVPSKAKVLEEGDLVKIDVCASWKGYCADMARCFFVGEKPQMEEVRQLVDIAQKALDKGIEFAVVGGKLTDISAAYRKRSCIFWL